LVLAEHLNEVNKNTLWADANSTNCSNSIHTFETHELRTKSMVYFVTRDPYTRLLSFYMDKVLEAGCEEPTEGAFKKCEMEGRTYGEKLGFTRDMTFKHVVEHLVKKIKGGTTLCGINHHLCLQMESCVTTTSTAEEVKTLKLEEMSVWFPCLLKELELNTTLLQGEQWTTFSHKPCFYSPTGSCDDMLRSQVPNTSKVAEGNVHATGASTPSLLSEHYDVETAQLVSWLYQDDIRFLDYPLWNETESPLAWLNS
jgi:hypothetical protein